MKFPAKYKKRATQAGSPLSRGTNISTCTAKTQYQNLKQILPENELRILSPNFYIHVSVSDFYIPTNGLLILLQENM
jgi:hypothetical protein